MENYELCSKLFLFKNGFDIPDSTCDIGMERYIINALAVFNYHVNLEECVEVFLDFGLLAFNPGIPSVNDIDFIDVANRVIEYLQQKEDQEMCEYISKMRGQIMKYRATGKLWQPGIFNQYAVTLVPINTFRIQTPTFYP